jgi:TRAP-type mannitol/chloroaromatic compound transport system substrate-binding protein
MPILQESAEYFAKRVGELSNGRLLIDMNPAGTIVPTFELADAVHKGVVDVGCGWAGYWRGTFPASPLFGAVEGGPDTMEYLAWVLVGGGLELWQEMYDRKNWQVKVLPPYSAHGPENFAWTNKPIRTLQDFKGLRFRTAGYYWGKVLTKMGASVVTLPGAEVIPSLERRVIDAAEWSMPCIDVTMGFHQICKYLVIPGVHQPSSLDETLIHKKSWEKLPADLKSIVWTATRDSSLYIMTREMKLNPPALKSFRDKGVEIITLSPEVQTKAKQLGEEVHNETAAQDPFFAKVLNSMREFRKTWAVYKEAFKITYQ